MADNPFAGLAQQVLAATATIRGLNAVLTSAGTGMQTFRNVVTSATAALGPLGAVIGGFVGALAGITQAVLKATAGLAAMGAAALGPAGFSVLGQVMQYLISVIGAVGVPVFGLLAAVALTVADMFKDKLLGAGQAVASFLVKDLIPALVRFAQNVAFGGSAMGRVFEAMWIGWRVIYYKMLSLFGVDVAKELADLWKQKLELEGRNQVAIGERENWNRPVGLPGRAQLMNMQPGGKGFLGDVADNLRDIIVGLKGSLGAQGNVGFAGVADVSKQIQLQAFQNNIQRKTLDMVIKNIAVLEKLEKWLRQFGAPAFVPAVGR